MLASHHPIVIATLTGEGYPSVITLEVDSLGQEIVRFRGNLDVDADGANGQHGLPAAYKADNTGTDLLANVGYPRDPDEYSDGLICHPGTRTPILFPGGIYASRTALRMPGVNDPQNPEIGVDAEYFPYIVIPPIIRQKTVGKCLGCKAFVIHHGNGNTSPAVTADIGPRNKDGEGSPALCRALGVNPNPRTGGTDFRDIEYILYPGLPANLFGTQFNLQ